MSIKLSILKIFILILYTYIFINIGKIEIVAILITEKNYFSKTLLNVKWKKEVFSKFNKSLFCSLFCSGSERKT
jgi:hypothetical protein